MREALLVADHNAYHIGQLVLRRLLGAQARPASILQLDHHHFEWRGIQFFLVLCRAT
jgi:hypothetical protein